MAESKIKRIIRFLKLCLKESEVKVSNIILFGSHAKGLASKGSDIDIVIVSDDFKGKDLFERARLTKEAEIKTMKKFLVPLDILTMTVKEWYKSKSMLI